MSLSMFKNKIYNMIIAVSLVVAIVTVTSYVPEMFEKRNNKKEQVSNEVNYEEPQVKVESAIEYQALSRLALGLGDTNDFKERKRILSNLENSIENTKEVVLKETEDAKSKTNSGTIKKRAEEYKQEVVKEFDGLLLQVNTLSQNINDNSMSDSEIKKEIESIQNNIDEMMAVESPAPIYDDEGHGMTESYETTEVVGEQTVTTFSNKDLKTNDEEAVYLELNDEMKEIADSLVNPADIYEYVRNNYMYKQYTGLRLGAVGTFEQRTGNDFDLAALLIALYRYKGYEAKFVVGNVDIDIDKAINWLGVKTEQAAVDAMSMLGVATQYGIDDEGNITKLRIEHTWVKVKVPYDSYRGAGKVSGEEIWVEVDPSFKQFKEEIEENKLENFLNSEFSNTNKFDSDLFLEELEYTDFSDIYNINAYTDDGIFKNNDIRSIQKELAKYANENELQIEELASILGIRAIIKDESGYLPTSLPYSVVKRTDELEYLTSEYLDTITFSLQNALYGTAFAGSYDATVSFFTADLYGHEVSLVYEPATSEDKKTIESYGDLFLTPSYLVRVIPVIKIDGETVLKGKSAIPGLYTNLIMDINEAGIAPVKVENALVAGGIYGITFDYNTINDRCLEPKYEETKECLSKLRSGEADLTEGTAVLTNMIGEVYFGALDMYNQLIAHYADVQWGRTISECVVGYRPKQSMIMGIPTAISDGCLYIDVDTDTMGLACNDLKPETEGQDDNIKMFMLSSGIVGSYLEGYVMEEATGKNGISTISVLAEAQARGIDIVTLDKENETLLDSLKLSATTKREIKTAINNGKTVVVPESEMYYYDWFGTGYIILNTETGEAAYMISGGLCGGESLDFPMMLFVIFVAVAAVLGLMAFEVMALSACAAIFGTILSIATTGKSVLDMCVLLLGIVGYGFALADMGYFMQDVKDFFEHPTIDGGMDVTKKSFTAVVSAMIFEYALPRLLPSGGYDSGRLYNKLSQSEYFDDILEVTDDYTDDILKTTDDYVDDVFDTVDDYIDDVIDSSDDVIDDVIDSTDDIIKNTEVKPTSEMPDNEFWKATKERYGKEISDKIKSFGDDGRRILEKYGDDVAAIIKDMPDEEAKQALELIKEHGDDAVNQLKNGYSVTYTNAVVKYGECSQEFSDWESMKEYFKGKVTNFKKECKPKYSRDINKWFAEGGTIKIDINNGHMTWTYTNSVGDSVPYIDGYIQFPEEYFYPGIKNIDIESFSGDRGIDNNKIIEILDKVYNISGGIPEGYTPHHDVTDGIIQLIKEEIHKQFTHIGGHSLCGGN